MESDSSIFRIGKPDLPRVRSLAQRIWPEAYAGILPVERIQPMVDDIYELATLAADIDERGHWYWLATVDSKDTGFASAYREADRIWIKKLYLLSEVRRTGLGKRLMAAAMAAFPDATSVALYVNNGNAPAIDFYRAQGFVVEAEVPVRMGPFEFKDFVMTRSFGHSVDPS
jgi:ribosomal protein S18 acetylase RimI-like enzyme